MTDVTEVMGYRMYSAAEHVSPRGRTRFIAVKRANGPACLIKLNPITGAILEINGDKDPFEYWLNNMRPSRRVRTIQGLKYLIAVFRVRIADRRQTK